LGKKYEATDIHGARGTEKDEHRTSNVEWEKMKKQSWNNLRSGATSLFNVRRSMFDPPEADKCLLAYGELDVHLYNIPVWHNATRESLQNNLALIYGVCAGLVGLWLIQRRAE
jgi:hypothetical protein